MKNTWKKGVLLFFCSMLCLIFTACEVDPYSNVGTAQGQNQEQEAITGDNVFAITYEKLEAGKIRAVVSLNGTVKIAGFSGSLTYDASVLECLSTDKNESSIYLNSENAGVVSFSCAGTSDITAEKTLFVVDFAYNGSVNTTLDLQVEEASDAMLNDVAFTCRDVTVKVD